MGNSSRQRHSMVVHLTPQWTRRTALLPWPRSAAVPPSPRRAALRRREMLDGNLTSHDDEPMTGEPEAGAEQPAVGIDARDGPREPMRSRARAHCVGFGDPDVR
jgi:hypothetical protein